MKKFLTRAMVLMLAIIMIVTSTVIPAFAKERAVPEKNNASVSISSQNAADKKFAGENSFGRMLAGLMDEQMAEQAERERFIMDVSVEGKTATVQFLTDREADLVVGIYTDADEDNMELIASGRETVYPEMEKAEVSINIDTMPAYFVTGVYMTDPDTHEPICSQHINRMNTQELREVMDKSMDDYPQDDVLDLDTDDTDKETNYAVIGDQTKRFETEGDTNKVTFADEENQTYVIENASSELRQLKKGDVFILDQGNDNVLVGVILSITVEGTTVTITTDPDAELNDVFDIVKIDETATAKDCSFEESDEAKEKGIEVTTGATDERSLDADVDVEGNFELKAKGTFLNDKKDENNYVKINGSISFSFEPSVKLVLTWNYQYLKFDFPVAITAQFNVEGKGGKAWPSLPLGKVFAFFGPVKLSMDATPTFSVKGKGSLTIKAKAFVGAVVDSQAKSKVSPYIGAKFEGVSLSSSIEMFFGLAIAPTASIVDEHVAKTDVKAQVGFFVTASNKGKITYDDSVTHMCGNGMCIDGSVDLKASITFETELLSWLTWNKELKAFKIHLTNFYISLKYKEFGFGTCPHKLTEINVSVYAPNSKAAAGAAITAKNAENGKAAKTYVRNGDSVKESAITTNSKGAAKFYVKYGTFKLTASKNGYKKGTKKVTLHGEKKNVRIDLGKDSSGGSDPDDPDEPDDPDDPDAVASGYCGLWVYEDDVPDVDDGSGAKNIKWSLSEDGTLTFTGKGQMRPYGGGGILSYENLGLVNAPWKDDVKKVVFRGSITSIGGCAFAECPNLTEITLPETLYDGEIYYHDDGNLVDEEDSTYIKENEALDYYTFMNCPKLKTVIIPENAKLERIPDEVFVDCASLTEVQLPDSLDYIKDAAFSGCESLASISLPANLTMIGPNVFSNCGLTHITLPSKLETIDISAFSHCPLQSVVIPASVTRIGSGAFGYNETLEEVYFKGDAPELSDDDGGDFDGTPFSGVEELTIYTPSGNSTWTNDVKTLFGRSDPDYEDPDYDPDITWNTWVPTRSLASDGTFVPGTKGDTASTDILSDMKTMSTYTGDYETDDNDVATSDFDDLVPGEEYVLAVVKDKAAEDLMSDDNLVYIWQKAADEYGSLSFSYIMPDLGTDEDGHDIEPDVMLYGAGGTSIYDLDYVYLSPETYYYSTGERIFPEVYLEDEYGSELEEGVDYELSGDVSAVEPGEYEIKINCKGDYYGTMALTYNIDKNYPYVYCENKKLVVGKSVKLAVYKDTDAKLAFKSSSPKTAAVDQNGKVTAKSVGAATIRISAPENEHNYSASTSVRITVVPKATTLKKTTKNVKGRKIKAVWKKGSGITGYHVQYSLKKNFKGAKTITVKKAKKTSTIIKKLKKKKTYYVRVRTYKKVGSKTYSSSWSKPKKVKIKK